MRIIEYLDRVNKFSADIRAWEKLQELAFDKSVEPKDAIVVCQAIVKNATDQMGILARIGGQGKSIMRWRRVMYEALLRLAEWDFRAYMRFMERDRDPDQQFYMPRRIALTEAIRLIQDIEDNVIDVGSISMPPGVGKTTLGLFAMSWFIGKYPNNPCLASGFADKLTRSFYDGVLELTNTSEYLWSTIFPDVRLESSSAQNETINYDRFSRNPSLTCRPIGGQLTGVTRCEKLLYVDDLCSGIEEALSPSRLDSLWTKYSANLKSRKKDGCKELHIATRWSINDPIGRLQRQYEDDSRARFVALSALNEDGQSNFDYMYSVGFSTKYFLDMKDTLDDVTFKCLYENKPIEREGIVYHPDELKRFEVLPKGSPSAVVAVVDPKTSGKDFFVAGIFAKYTIEAMGKELDAWYFVDCICSDNDYKIIMPQLTDLFIKYGVGMCKFESNSAGLVLADNLDTALKERGYTCEIIAEVTTSNKETKIIVNSPWVKENVYFKSPSRKEKRADGKIYSLSNYTRKDNYGLAMEKLCSYSSKIKNPNDDVPDMMAMFAIFAKSLEENYAIIGTRPY